MGGKQGIKDMKLTVKDGKLRLRSAFKLMFFGWLFIFAAFFALAFLILILVAVVGAPIVAGGGAFSGSAALIQLVPMLIIYPISAVFYAVFLAGFAVLGLLIYRIFWPIRIDGAITPSVFE